MAESALMRGFPALPDHQVTLANWLKPPFNRWSFHHAREVVPTACIHRPNGPAAPMRRSDRAVDRIAFQAADGREWTVERMLAETFTDGFLVLHRGRVVAERYDNSLVPESRHIVFSVSKSITGSLSGILADRGLLDPDSPVTRYIPEAAGSAYGDCTVRHVLDMTVAVEFVENYLDSTGDFARYRAATGWIPIVDPTRLADLRSFLVTLKRGAGPHGPRFHYVSPNSDLLGWILERAAGVPYARLLSELIWQPMGAEFDGDIAVDRLGAPRSAGGICVALRDLGRFGELMRRRGMAEGRQIIPGWWIDDILANGDPAAWKHSEMARFVPNGRYRSKWYVIGNDRGAFCAIGIHGQWIYVDPAAEVVIVKFSSQPLAVDEATDQLLLAGFHALAGALMGQR